MSRGMIHWEGCDLEIPLAISIRHRRTPDYVGVVATSAQPIIKTYQHKAARDGWRPNEPTKFATLFSRTRPISTLRLRMHGTQVMTYGSSVSSLSSARHRRTPRRSVTSP